jgi:hypothetical protein
MIAVATLRRAMWTVAALVLVAATAAACSVRDTLPPPNCGADGSIIIVAQSVPTATFVPCLEALPAGWSVATVEVNQDHSVVTLDSDRAGTSGAVLTLTARCAGRASPALPTERPGVAQRVVVERAAPSYRAERFYSFAGGCVTFSFDFDRGTPGTESTRLVDALVLVSRAELDDDVRQFVGEET